MDRSWILHYRNRFSAEYIAGVNSFLDFAKANSGGAMLINCPCNDCCNHRKHDYATVRSHLHIKGMMVHYLRWIYHGEPIVQPDDSDESEDESEENRDEYNELIDDHRRGTYLEEDTQERDDVHDFENLLNASQRHTLQTAQNAGQAPPITQFFRDTHYRRSRNEWVNEVAQQRHEALVQRTEEQSQPSVTTPMTEEQIAADVLGKRSGYAKGFGIYTRTSSSSTQSRAPDPEVIALREQLAEQAEQLAEQDRRQAEQDRRTRQLEAFVQRLAATAGINPAAFIDTTRGTTSTGDGTAPGRL